MTLTEARQHLADVVNRAAYTGEGTPVQRRLVNAMADLEADPRHGAKALQGHRACYASGWASTASSTRFAITSSSSWWSPWAHRSKVHERL